METLGTSLEAWLSEICRTRRERTDVAAMVLAMADAARDIAHLVAKGPLTGALGAATGEANADGDTRRSLDVIANDRIRRALAVTATRYFASEEEEAILTLAAGGSLAVAVDPLDGSSNIDANISIGTIFSAFDASPAGASASFLRAGRGQVAAGYFIYGPQTALMLSVGLGTQAFVLDPDDGIFKLVSPRVGIAPTTSEFAINASNYRHWLEPVRTFIDDCLEGADGPRARDFNMRWVASLVAETHRIFARGGVFLYPADARNGYGRGRLRLVYEAAPIAMLVEQADGMAIDGHARILDIVPQELHQRTPLIFGSADMVARIQAHHTNPSFVRDQSPLFRKRGLFNA